MPRIDPQQLLKTLGILLSPSGGIKSSEEVDRLVKLMSKFSRKLVSKCIYVQILKATPAELLSKFLAEGGWQLLNTWFDDAIKAHNWPLVREMLHLFHFCPMTAELLKENASEHQAPKLINQLRQEASIQADIRGLALDIYKSWVAVVSSPLVKTVENSSNHQLPDPAAENSDDSATNGRAPDEASGPVSLLQSLADEVSESIKK
jgi:protein phosphatase 1 regulatory subunit 10